MYWREDEQRIYVLFNDKRWASFDDTWNSNLPEDACPSVSVGANLVKPKRGFGKVWCEQTIVRSKIGAASAGETGGLAAPVQRFGRGLVFGGNSGKVFALFADGKWE
jgi:hypothetical protein